MFSPFFYHAQTFFFLNLNLDSPFQDASFEILQGNI